MLCIHCEKDKNYRPLILFTSNAEYYINAIQDDITARTVPIGLHPPVGGPVRGPDGVQHRSIHPQGLREGEVGD